MEDLSKSGYCRDLHADGTPVTDAHPVDWMKEVLEGPSVQFAVPCRKEDEGARPSTPSFTIRKS